MKIKCHENTGLVYISTETADDQFHLGKLASKLQGSQVYQITGGRELQISISDLLAALIKN